jgi:hypothetical protein
MSETIKQAEVIYGKPIDYEELLRLVILDKIRRKHELKLPQDGE